MWKKIEGRLHYYLGWTIDSEEENELFGLTRKSFEDFYMDCDGNFDVCLYQQAMGWKEDDDPEEEPEHQVELVTPQPPTYSSLPGKVKLIISTTKHRLSNYIYLFKVFCPAI